MEAEEPMKIQQLEQMQWLWTDSGPTSAGSWICQAHVMGAHIFLGDRLAARNSEWLLRNNIGMLLRCNSVWDVYELGVRKPPPEMIEHEFSTSRVFLRPGHMLRQLQSVMTLVLSHWHDTRELRNILIWCEDGKEVAPAVVACLLLQLSDRLSADEVMNKIKLLRAGAMSPTQFLDNGAWGSSSGWVWEFLVCTVMGLIVWGL
jgi:hypothetical protein